MISNETLKIIKQRRSTRSFRTEQIKEEELQAVLEAGLYAPYTWEQGRHFTVIQNKELLGRLNIEAKEAALQLGLEDLAQLAGDKEYNCIYGAPTLIIVSGSEQSPIPLEADCAAATQNMLLAAESMELGSCWIYFVMFALNSPQGGQLRKELGIPEGFRPYYSAAIGYKTDTAVVTAERKTNLIIYTR
ncbi:MAG TPA: nitroreductase family protein [Candidatus Nitrosocosmicus sp.]|nr:nitroreductase family protein [Candidatus Nitrosocosmicus sp.]